jgi:hypothetical protein
MLSKNHRDVKDEINFLHCQVVEREERARHRADSDGNRLLSLLTLVGWCGGPPSPLCRLPGGMHHTIFKKKKRIPVFKIRNV